MRLSWQLHQDREYRFSRCSVSLVHTKLLCLLQCIISLRTEMADILLHSHVWSFALFYRFPECKPRKGRIGSGTQALCQLKFSCFGFPGIFENCSCGKPGYLPYREALKLRCCGVLQCVICISVLLENQQCKCCLDSK